MESLRKSIKNILEDNKAESIVMVDVKNKSSVTDLMFIASGRSTRHVKAIADNLVTKLKKKNKIKPFLNIKSFPSLLNSNQKNDLDQFFYQELYHYDQQYP